MAVTQQVTVQGVLDLAVTVFIIAALFLAVAAAFAGWDRILRWLDRPRGVRVPRPRRATFDELVDLDRETPRERERREAADACNELRGWRS